MTHVVIVLTTLPVGTDRADTVASTLVAESLAACVRVSAPGKAHYRWKGRVETTDEHQLVIKTTRDRLPELERRLRALHPYECPEWLVVAVDAVSDDYLAWLTQG